MIITNGCVTLRAIEEKDFELLYEMMNSATIEKAMGHCTLPVSQKDHREWMANFKNSKEQIRLMIEVENGTTIGVMMLFDIDMQNGTAELGHKLSTSTGGRMKGDINDAVNGMLDYAFNILRLNCVYARTIEGNIFAEKILKKSGFVPEGTLRARVYQDGKYLNMHSFSVVREDFMTRNQ